jgi:hypothetical protein
MHLRYRKWIHDALSCVTSFAFLAGSVTAKAAPTNTSSAEETKYEIILDEAELIVTHGQYSELEVFLKTKDKQEVDEAVTWGLAYGQLPKGLSLEDSTSSRVLIFGTPQFSNRWCFVLSATTESG